MKYLFVLFACICFLNSFSQKLPNIILKNIEGENINVSEIDNFDNPIILCFWKSCCISNINMLDEINEVYPDWKEETGVLIIAIAIDDSRSSSKVSTLANGRAWEYEILLDVNSDFKRAMSVNTVPHIFILNKDNELIWQAETYFFGDENEIFDILINIHNEK